MDVSPIQVLIFIVAFIAGIDQFSFLESLYQPIVNWFLVGLILGDVQTGLGVGGTYQLMTIGSCTCWWCSRPMLLSAALCLAVFAITTKLGNGRCSCSKFHSPTCGQYAVTIILPLCPVMAAADAYARGCPRNCSYQLYGAMAALSLFFEFVIVTLFFLGGFAFWNSDHHGILLLHYFL